MELRRRNISYLFQNYGLIDTETVESNMRIATHFNKRLSGKKEKKLISMALEQVGLQGYERRKVFTVLLGNAPVPIVWEGGIDYLYKDFMKPQTFAYAFAIFFHRSYSKKNQPSLCTQYVVDKVILFCASLVYMIQLLYQAIPVA